jgi:hypothetical protein
MEPPSVRRTDMDRKGENAERSRESPTTSTVGEVGRVGAWDARSVFDGAEAEERVFKNRANSSTEATTNNDQTRTRS